MVTFQNMTAQAYNYSPIVLEKTITPLQLTNDLLHIVFWCSVVALLVVIILIRLCLDLEERTTIFGHKRMAVALSFQKDWVLKNKKQFIKWNLFVILILCLSWIINHLSVIIWGIGV